MMALDDLYKSPRTRSSITRLSFGRNRKAEFPDYFFCHGCGLWEDAVLTHNKCANRKQKMYMCNGGHVDPTHPTTFNKDYRPNNSCCVSFADDEEKKGSKSSSMSPLKKKIRRVSAASRQALTTLICYHLPTSWYALRMSLSALRMSCLCA
jgi:hypothetical protein